MDKDDIRCLIWVIFCTPLPMILPVIMVTVGFNEQMCEIFLRFMYTLWIFVFTATCFIGMYMIATMDRMQKPADSTDYKILDKVIYVSIFILSTIIAYYVQLDA
ncbi:hypothetical protein GQ473_03060 [archaeon]|nr:hypothetical protein [archaeon]